MHLSETSHIKGVRMMHPIGRISATSHWFASLDAPAEARERQLALERLMREAQDYEADALIEVEFAKDQIAICDLASRILHRITARAVAVRIAA